ncbi:MAG: hypothetical protein AAFX99_24355 [Myxococcota bacterium]
MTALSQWSDLLLKSLEPLDEPTLERMYARHVTRLRFDDAQWSHDAHPEAMAMVKASIDAPVAADDVRDLIMAAEEAASHNPMLVEILEHLHPGHDPAADPKVWVDIAMHGLLLERITRTVVDDPTKLLALIEHFKAARNEVPWRRYVPMFLALKLGSIERPLQRVAHGQLSGHVSPSFMRWELVGNILEATLYDMVTGHVANARVGAMLLYDARRAVSRIDARTWSIATPNAKRWTDLYTVWNLAFITRYGHFPFMMAKLLIPSVNGYHTCPEGYLHRRVIALYLQLHWSIFMRYERQGEVELNWSSAPWIRRWGKLNLKMART